MEKDPNDSNKNLGIKIQDCYSIKDGENSGELDEEKASAQTGLDLSVPKAPPDEFAKIMAEMERRNITPRIHWELKVRNLFLSVARGMRRPVVAAALAVALIFTTAAGVSARKAYNYRMRENGVGKVVLNNDETTFVLKEKMDEVYETIQNELGIKPLKMYFMPREMEYKELYIQSGKATIQYMYNNRKINFVQQSRELTVSLGVSSDRELYDSIYNKFLDKTIDVRKNELTDSDIEYSVDFVIMDTYYHLSGIMEADEFVEIIENLGY